MKTIIIGGMGPQASLELHKRILEKSRAHHNGASNEYPEIFHQSLSIKDFISSKKHELAAIKSINDALSAISIDDETQICIPCNTAHGLIDRIDVPNQQFVSMIDATVAEVVLSGETSIGLLASENTLKSGLYSKPLKALGFTVLQPSAEDIVTLQELIRGVINGTPVDSLRERLNDIVDNLINSGAKAIVLGCTELPIIGVTVDAPVFDCLEALTNELIRRKYLL